MKRLFIKIKTGLRMTGTLFEVSGESDIGRAIDQIVSSMDGLPKEDEGGERLEYSLIKLGNPKLLLDKLLTFLQVGIRNSDLLLLTPDPESIMSQGPFDFEPLSIENQYVSIQEIRAPLRLSRATAPKANLDGGPSAQAEKPAVETKVPSEAANSSKGPFSFQPLDLGASEQEEGLKAKRRTQQKPADESKKERRR